MLSCCQTLATAFEQQLTARKLFDIVSLKFENKNIEKEECKVLYDSLLNICLSLDSLLGRLTELCIICEERKKIVHEKLRFTEDIIQVAEENIW